MNDVSDSLRLKYNPTRFYNPGLLIERVEHALETNLHTTSHPPTGASGCPRAYGFSVSAGLRCRADTNRLSGPCDAAPGQRRLSVCACRWRHAGWPGARGNVAKENSG